MTQHTGQIEAVYFGSLRPDDIEDGLYAFRDEPGTYTVTVSGLPEDITWGPGMTATITPKETP